MVVGVATVAILMLTKRDPFLGINAGFFALCLNFATVAAVSLVARAQVNVLEEEIQEDVEANKEA